MDPSPRGGDEPLGAAAGACPDENELAALVDGVLPAEAVARVERHLRLCPACAELFTELGHSLAPAAPTPDDSDNPWQRYELLDTIGAGGMGVVHLAFDRQLRRRVALKVIRPELADSPEGRRVRQRLVREARSQARLSHPNVVTVYDVGTLDDQVFIAAEYVKGRTVTEWLRQERPRWEAIVEVFLQAGQGLVAAHAAGLVHRDVKPDNLLVGADGRVRVTDFGLATRSAAPDTAPWAGAPAGTTTGPEPGYGPQPVGLATAPTVAYTPAGAPHPSSGVEPGRLTAPNSSTWSPGALTTVGALVGTPAYMAPEQLGGSGADAASDQFSFAVSLYEALYGPRPYEGQTLGALLERMRQGIPGPPPRPGPGDAVPPGVLAVLQKGLQPDPRARWASMEALLGALHVAAFPGRGAAGVRPATTLWRTAAIVGLVVALGIAIGVVVLLSSTRRSAEPEPPGAGAPSAPLTARQQLARFLAPGADARALTQQMEPRLADCRAYFVADLAEKACAYYRQMFRRGGIRPGAGQTEIRLWKATVTELQRGAGASHYFPGGYRRASKHLRPGHTVYRWKFVKPGASLGMAFDGLVWVNGRWVFFPKPWRLLRRPPA